MYDTLRLSGINPVKAGEVIDGMKKISSPITTSQRLQPCSSPSSDLTH